MQDFKSDSKPENDPGKQYVTQISSHDALESYMPLLESSHYCHEDTEMEEVEESRSDFEDEKEFKHYSRRWKRRGAR